MRSGEPKKSEAEDQFTWSNKNESETPLESTPIESESIGIREQSQNTLKPHQHIPASLSPDHWLFDSYSLKLETRKKVDEVFLQGTYSGFVGWIRELQRNKLHSYIFARTVQVTLDKADNEQEVSWGLLELLYTAKIIAPREIRRGFDRLYRWINDIIIDSPNAAEIILELLNKIISSGVLSSGAVLRVPLQVYNLGRGINVLRNIKVNDIVIGDLLEVIAETKESIINKLQEYYASGVSEGVIEFIKQNKIYGSLVVRKSVELALDRKNSDKELCSRLLGEISGYCHPETLVEGFDDILWNTKELVIDVPDAGEIISKFIARAIVDDCLPSNYIYESEVLQDETLEIKILVAAFNTLKPKEAYTSLQSVWGPQGNTIEDYKLIFKNIIQELFDSRDVRNAEECLKELTCAHYMHEFIKKIIETVMDKTPQEEKMILEFIKGLEGKLIILPDQIDIGIQRIELNLPQLILDVPKASEILSNIKKQLGR
jgi:MA3 domain